MSTYSDLVDTLGVIRERTGDPNAWQVGLTPTEVAAVLSPATGPAPLAAILGKIRQRYANILDRSPVPAPPAGPAQGDAAEAIAAAEAALAHQNSVTSQLDLQVVSAILNAHLNTVDGAEALNRLQRDVEAAVRTRSDLDTPAGARDFQRFLIGKLRDIRGVVANASLDDTSKSALMAAWTSLYNASKDDGPSERRPAATPAATQPARAVRTQPATAPDAGSDPLLDSLLLDEPGLLDEPSSLSANPTPLGAGVPATAPTPAMPMPGFGGATLPAGGSLPSWGGPGELPLANLTGGRSHREPEDFEDDLLDDEPDARDRKSTEEGDEENTDDAEEKDPPAQPQSLPAGPTTVTLPNGETVTAASPQLAAAIKAAAGGTPIAEAFQQQGITIPPPGTAVPKPLDATQLVPGDIGMFTDRHALALGRSRALLDGQIQQISTVSGPSFLGWEHPPTPTTATAPAGPDAPTPTKPSARSTAT
ncbi:hypothetical protein MKUB_30770 [Mycobacterium kubicae]|uniref:DUF4226 domain-containing protein n=1 Tax=Mycobacterium kubicae TaxID=120959 RepID=A0AAX1JCE6_9MYCO|nr:DUF4226 domain-containing protein [Mycobacterium kubicae]MCV7094329.1 DUF4226 domain-containing protein [Mycobacterium kubicae]ORV98976.1 hypothetical protein AWC13_12325 [Mycobacterium kubicae]QNI09869.1 DUF4226 domain-containing protein [Mycobacterium kubicae]QPI38067.1 DUF4226 domain-containing protein [Mycobacterium kubicae]GFG65587.1 hypothetical protein MKUB_30770 [Mycobacterium kubicae]